MTKPKTVIAMILSLMLVFVMTACGSKTEPEPESEPQTETGHETTEESDDYDIASNLQLAGGGDEKAIRRLVSILLDNALKYSEENGTIRIDLHPKGKGIQLTIFNTTPSMPRESLKYLFDRFYRTDKSRNSETGGYGIGLSIAQSIVNAHKGSITASTEDEKSLTIQITL